MLKQALFDELTRLGACAAAVSFLRLQNDPVVALATLPLDYRDWLAHALSLPAWKAFDGASRAHVKAILALTSKADCEAYEEAWKAYREAAPAEIMNWYEGL